MQGAKGILVNITAGSDLSIGEFEEVGNAVKAFASENATVVVGTVIDDNMNGELRVTIVATGIGQLEVAGEMTLVSSADQAQQSTVEETDIDRLRLAMPVKKVVGGDVSVSDGNDLKYLDVPAFLRRQNN